VVCSGTWTHLFTGCCRWKPGILRSRKYEAAAVGSVVDGPRVVWPEFRRKREDFGHPIDRRLDIVGHCREIA